MLLWNNFSQDIVIPISDCGHIQHVYMDKGMLCASVYDQSSSSTIYKVFDLSKVDWSKTPTEVAETIKASSAELTYKGEFMSIDSKGPTYLVYIFLQLDL